MHKQLTFKSFTTFKKQINDKTFMRLYEYEAKNILSKRYIPVPKSQLFTSPDKITIFPCVAKVQLLFGNRRDLGGIKICKEQSEANNIISKFLESDFKGEKVTKVLVEELVSMQKEYYVGFLFDTDERSPILLFNTDGGSGIEERGASKLVINPIKGLSESDAQYSTDDARVAADGG